MHRSKIAIKLDSIRFMTSPVLMRSSINLIGSILFMKHIKAQLKGLNNSTMVYNRHSCTMYCFKNMNGKVSQCRHNSNPFEPKFNDLEIIVSCNK